jgi:hypothetical protein
MVQQGQVFQLTRCGPRGERLWAYRYRIGGRDSKRVQRGGFALFFELSACAAGRQFAHPRRRPRPALAGRSEFSPQTVDPR